MDAVFAPAHVLDTATQRSLVVHDDGKSLRHLLLQLTGALASLGVGVYAGAQWQQTSSTTWMAVLLVATLVHGVFNGGFFGLLHESCHLTVFKRRGANVVAGWVAAVFQPMCPALMRAFHFAHHRHTHDVKHDPELAGMAMMASWPRHLLWLATVSGLPILFARFMWTTFAALCPTLGPFTPLWSKVLPFVVDDAKRRIAWESRLLLLVQLGLIALAVWQPVWAVFHVGMIVGHAVVSVYITCEHRGLPLADVEGNILARTRSVSTTPALRWLLWNMPYHAEHHGFPAVPWHQLPALHAHLQPHLVHHGQGVLALHLRRGQPAPRTAASTS